MSQMETKEFLREKHRVNKKILSFMNLKFKKLTLNRKYKFHPLKHRRRKDFTKKEKILMKKDNLNF